MLKGLFGKRRTTKADVVLAIGGALFGLWKAYDTVQEYKTDEEKEKE